MNIEAFTQTVTLRARELGTPAQTANPQSGPNVEAAAAPVPEAAPAKTAAPPVPDAAVKAAAEQIDSYLKSAGRNLDIRVDKDTGRTVVTVRDASTGDVIRQIPSEEALQLARSLGESSAALLSMTA